MLGEKSPRREGGIFSTHLYLISILSYPVFSIFSCRVVSSVSLEGRFGSELLGTQFTIIRRGGGLGEKGGRGLSSLKCSLTVSSFIMRNVKVIYLCQEKINFSVFYLSILCFVLLKSVNFDALYCILHSVPNIRDNIKWFLIL